MIAALIRWSIANRFLVLVATLGIAAWGTVSLLRTPLDAIPDLSDTQVIIRTSFPGQAPRIIEDQITYPLATTMMSVPGAKAVRVSGSMVGERKVILPLKVGPALPGTLISTCMPTLTSGRSDG
jgi:Cu(I)/Ag(I) efflux system membrane protein CusA/SilA